MQARATFHPCVSADAQASEITYPTDIERFSSLCEIPASKLLNHCMVRGSQHQMTMFGETISKLAYGKKTLSVLPRLLLDDENNLSRMPKTRRYRRGVWAIRHVAACALHFREIVELPLPERALVLEFCKQLTLRAGEVAELSSLSTNRQPSSFDIFAYERMSGGRQHGPLLDNLNIDVALDFGQLIGIALLHGKRATVTRVASEELIVATNTGFERGI